MHPGPGTGSSGFSDSQSSEVRTVPAVWCRLDDYIQKELLMLLVVA